MGFCSKGERLSSTQNTAKKKKKVEICRAKVQSGGGGGWRRSVYEKLLRG